MESARPGPPGRIPPEERPEIEGILAETFSRIEPPRDAAVVLAGSIAEGFGNPTSDVDFLFVAPGSEALPPVRTVLWIAGRRVEVHYRSVAWLRDFSSRVGGLDPDRREDVRSLSRSDLELYQQFCFSVPLVARPFLDEVRALYEPGRIAALVAAHFRGVAAERIVRAASALWLDGAPVAIAWTRSAVRAAAKAWMAGLG